MEMQFIKSRIDIRNACKKRLAECNAVIEEAVRALDPIMVQFEIKTPEEVIDRLHAVLEKGNLRHDDDLEKIVDTLTRYVRATGAREQFEFVIEHIASLGECADAEERWKEVPVEWHYQVLDQSEAAFYFSTYEGITDSPLNYHMGQEKARVRRGLERLRDAGMVKEVGLTSALRGPMAMKARF